MNTTTYSDLLSRKARYADSFGFHATVNDEWLFPFQRHAVAWALRGGRRALFMDTGLGKSRMQLAWASRVAAHTGGRVLILAPLAVGPQTVAEARKVGIDGVVFGRTPAETGAARVVVTNYDNLDKWAPADFVGVVLDESSILKSYTGAQKQALCLAFRGTPYRLACTATPAPNDYLELGNHSEFLGVMSSHQMIARWFITDQSAMGNYRLKGHAVRPFWDWVTSWALCAGLPSDVGDYSDAGYVLPELRLHRHVVQSDIAAGASDGTLFRMPGLSATGVHSEKRRTAASRAAVAASLVSGEPTEAWLLWCDTDYEAAEVGQALPGVIEVSGSMSSAVKSERLLGFATSGGYLLTKPKIAGFGMNWQNCARMIFVGGSYSYEAFYQAVRRCWRFGQSRPVDCHLLMSFAEQSMWDVVNGKADAHNAMKSEMFAASRRQQGAPSAMRDYAPTHMGRVPKWLINQLEGQT